MKKSTRKTEPVPFSPISSFQISFPIKVSKKKLFVPLNALVKPKPRT